MNAPRKRTVWVFDAYGTLFDIHSAVRKQAARLGESAVRLSQSWRTKQLEYSWVRSLMGRHADFWDCTLAALDFALAAEGLADPALRDALCEAYRTPDAYGDAVATLRDLRAGGASTAILSNGSPQMLAAAVSHAGFEPLLDAVLSVEEVGIFKPDSRVYELATARFSVAAAEIRFCSSNAWDIAGAQAFGFQTVWVNRTSQPEEYGIAAHAKVIRSLAEIAATQA